MNSRQFVIAVVLLGLGVATAQFVEATVPVGAGPVALALDSTRGKLFIANQNANSVAVLSTANNQVLATVEVGDHPVDVLVNPGAGKAYVCCAPIAGGDGIVYVINASTHAVIDSVTVGQSPVRMAWDRTDDLVFVLNRLDPSLSVIDCNTNQVIDERRLVQVPEDLIWGSASNKIYVTSGYYMQGGKVFIINAATRESLAVVTSGQDGYRLAYNPVNDRAYSGNRGNRTLTIIDGATNRGIATIATPSEPWTMLWIPLNKVFVGGYWTATTSFLRGAEQTIRGTFPGTPNAYSFAYNPNTQKIFSAGYLVGRVAVVDVRDGHEDVHDSIAVGNGPAAIVVSTDSNRVYVANSWDSTVTVLRDFVGMAEETRERGMARAGATVVRGVLRLPSSSAARYSLFDMTGRAVRSPVPGSNDVSDLTPGVYLLSARTANGAWRTEAKVVVE